MEFQTSTLIDVLSTTQQQPWFLPTYLPTTALFPIPNLCKFWKTFLTPYTKIIDYFFIYWSLIIIIDLISWVVFQICPLHQAAYTQTSSKWNISEASAYMETDGVKVNMYFPLKNRWVFPIGKFLMPKVFLFRLGCLNKLM